MRQLIAVFALLALPATLKADTIYVNASAGGANNGTSWANAYTDLQSALAVAAASDEVWVAAGTYKPTNTTDRFISFEVDGLTVYGGFAGTESSLSERDVETNVTILSGDIGIPADSTDNSFHVVYIPGNGGLFDGFTIIEGNADGSGGGYTDHGGGLFVYGNLTPTLQNLTFYHNHSGGDGGGMSWIGGTSYVLTSSNMTFIENTADGWGGGMRSNLSGGAKIIMDGGTFTDNTAKYGGGMTLSQAVLTDVTFTGNSVTYDGGAIRSGGFLEAFDCHFDDNHAGRNGGAVEAGNGNSRLTRCTLTNNTAANNGGGATGRYGGAFDCTFTGNEAAQGGGFYTDTPDTLSGCTLDGNTATTQGGGVATNGSQLVVQDGTVLTSNSAPVGGAMANDGGVVKLSNVIVTGNTAGSHAGVRNVLGAATLIDVVLWNNTATTDGGALYNESNTVTAVNLTVAGNTATGGNGGGVLNNGAAVDFTNVVIRDNSAVTGPDVYDAGGSTVTFAYSNVEGSGGSGAWVGSFGTDHGNNIDADAVFVDLGGGDVRLAAGSPSIGGGDPLSILLGVPFTDAAGNARFQGVRIDQGALETPYDCQGSVFYVDASATGSGSGLSWANAMPEVRDALAMAASCPGVTEIWVAAGTYLPTAGADRAATMQLYNNLAVYGGFAGYETNVTERTPVLNPTILSGEIGAPGTSDNSYHVVTGSGTDATAVLDGFIIEDGNADGAAPNDHGAGLINVGGSPTIRNNVFRNNTATDGAGIANDAGANPVLVNLSLYDNIATGDGGAIANDGSAPTITSVSTWGNIANQGGAIFNDNSSPAITNIVAWGNATTSGSHIANVNGAAPVVSYSDVEGSGGSSSWDAANGTDGGGNIDNDPLYLNPLGGLLHLTVGSPAIDTGDSTAIGVAATDMDLRPRIVGLDIDMGAYEFRDLPVIAATETLQVYVMQNGVAEPISICNNGGTDLNWQIVPPGGGFPAWFQLLQTAGTAGAGACDTISGNFNPTGLATGTYETSFGIMSDDLNNPLVTVTAIMDVDRIAAASLSDTSFVFPDLYLGSFWDMSITVTNLGDTSLVATVTVDDSSFSILTPALAIAPGDSAPLTVRFEPLTTGAQQGTVTILSNDDVSPSIQINASGAGIDAGWLSHMPDTISVALPPDGTTNETITVTHAGNIDAPYQVLVTFEVPPSPAPPARSSSEKRRLAPWETAADDGRGPARISDRPVTLIPGFDFYDGFEDGNYDGWQDGGGSGTKTVTSGTAANTTVYSYKEYNSSAGHSDGIYYEFGAIQPSTVSFWVRSETTDKYDCYFAFHDSFANEAIFFFATGTGTFYVNADVGGNDTYAYQAGVWYHIEFQNIDFSAKTFDYFVDGVLVQQGISFRNPGVVNDFDRLDLYHYSSGATGYWDEIVVSPGSLNGWLSVTPKTGTFVAAQNSDLTVAIDAAGLAAGTYRGDCRVHAAAPGSGFELFRVPVILLVDSTITAAGDPDNTPREFALRQNRPNPFNPVTSIHYDLARPSNVTLTIYDVAGRRVRMLVDRQQKAGRYDIKWDGTDAHGTRVASGVYFYRLVTAGFVGTRKMVMLK